AEPLKLNARRSGLHFYPVPFDKLVGPVCPEAKLRKLVRNMIYDGILANLLGIDMEEMRKSLFKQFGKRKVKAAELNMGALAAGFDYAAKNLPKSDPFRVEKMNATAGKIIIEGNAAAALGSMFAGVTVVTWYPITPSSSLVETLIGYLKRFRIDKETGKATYAVVQAEDELASIGMAMGAGWAGARSMTSTAGPGISLMSEFLGFGYYAEIPAVIFDVQRVGPSTGLPTRTAQGDIVSVAWCSHGDTEHLVLHPGGPEECFEFGRIAFDYAERFQTPVFESMQGSRIGIVAYRTTNNAMREARDQLLQANVKSDYLRLRATPLAVEELEQFLTTHDRIYVVEQNRDGQMEILIRAAVKT